MANIYKMSEYKMSEYKMSEYTNIIFGEQDDERVASQSQQKQSTENFCAWVFKCLKESFKNIYWS
jgi:hypothetical protein